MMLPIRSLLTLSTACWLALAATMSHAQSATERLDRIERDMQSLQRQLYRGGDGRSAAPADTGGTAAANLQIRFTALEEELRQLRGQVEESRYQNEQSARQLQLLQEDMEYRLNQIEQKIGLGLAVAPEAGAEATAQGAESAATATSPSAASAVQAQGTPPVPGTPVTPQTEPSVPVTTQNAKELYNAAIGLMNKAQYAEAATAFKQFISQYPKDKLLGNAYYWLGETYYVREDYVQAADQFRQGFETMPEGVKAPDNLLKLAMSLAKLDKRREACVVLQQIQIKYKTGPDTVLGRAGREADTLNCQP
jgi:tol-pal system protein YbgF